MTPVDPTKPASSPPWESAGLELVAGRECGGCAVCCSELQIDAPELKKLAGVRCPNCSAQNLCGIYESRPQVCREFHCAWRALPSLGDDWRPDRSGILLMPQTKGIPTAYRGKAGVQILIAHPSAIRKKELPGLLAAWVGARVPVFLTVPAPAGFVAHNTFLNDLLNDIVARQDRPGMLRTLERVIASLALQKPLPATFAGAAQS